MLQIPHRVSQTSKGLVSHLDMEDITLCLFPWVQKALKEKAVGQLNGNG